MCTPYLPREEKYLLEDKERKFELDLKTRLLPKTKYNFALQQKSKAPHGSRHTPVPSWSLHTGSHLTAPVRLSSVFSVAGEGQFPFDLWADTPHEECTG